MYSLHVVEESKGGKKERRRQMRKRGREGREGRREAEGRREGRGEGGSEDEPETNGVSRDGIHILYAWEYIFL